MDTSLLNGIRANVNRPTSEVENIVAMLLGATTMTVKMATKALAITLVMLIGIVTGNPGVFQGYPYPYPDKPIPTNKGKGSCGFG